MSKMRCLLAIAAACALAACNSITSENEGQLAMYLENAARYYDAAQYKSAMQQWDQALEIDSGNDKARLGQAMARYQMGRGENKESLEYLAAAEQSLDQLRREDLNGQEWKAELGFALVHERWTELYDRKVRKLSEDAKLDKAKAAELETSRKELSSHMAAAQASFEKVLGGEEKEARDKLTSWLGLARIAAWRGDYPTAIKYAELYEKQIVRSKNLWRSAAERFPKDAPIYEAKLKGAEMQEAELKDLVGNCYFKLGRLDEAEKALNEVIALFPDRAPPYLNRGIIRETRGDFDLARGDYKRFLTLTELPETDPAIFEATRRLTSVQSKLDETP